MQPFSLPYCKEKNRQSGFNSNPNYAQQLICFIDAAATRPSIVSPNAAKLLKCINRGSFHHMSIRLIGTYGGMCMVKVGRSAFAILKQDVKMILSAFSTKQFYVKNFLSMFFFKILARSFF